MNTNSETAGTDRRVDMPVPVDPISRALGVIAIIGVAVIVVICILVQFLQTDLDWITAEMSIYVLGPYGEWVRASFFAPAPGLVALGFGLYRILDERSRSKVSLVLFIAAGIALCFTGAFLTDTTPWPVTLHGKIHQWAAFGTFVFATTAMTLQSWRLRYDPRWRVHFPDAFTIATVAIVYFWVYALFHPIPRGLGEKIVIGLVLLWVWRAAWWLVRQPNRSTKVARLNPTR